MWSVSTKELYLEHILTRFFKRSMLDIFSQCLDASPTFRFWRHSASKCLAVVCVIKATERTASRKLSLVEGRGADIYLALRNFEIHVLGFGGRFDETV